MCCVGSVQIQIELGKCRCTADTEGKKSNVSSVGPLSERNIKDQPETSDEGPTLETLDFTVRIGSTSTFYLFRFV